MTTKMIATRGDAVMPCCVVLLLLMLGVPSGQTQCRQKIAECYTLQINISTELSPLVTPPYNVTALETACSSMRQDMTDCVREANESCSGQPDMLGTLTNSSTLLDLYCGPALVCQLKATTCQAPVLAVLPTGPPSGNESETTGGADLMQQLCPAYEQAAECLQALTATDQCREVEVVTNMTSSIAMAASGCAGVPSGQTQCGQKITECKTLLLNVSTELLPHLTPPYNNVTALETACSSQKQLTDCVREANESCSGQTDMLGSLANLTSLDSFCKPALVCQLKATTCRALVLAVLPTGPPSGSESESTRGADLMQQLCPAYEQAAECLQALTATDQCREVEVVTNMTSSIAMAASGCAGVPSGQTQCGQKITECKTLLLNVSTELLPHLTPPYNNVTALETACSSQKQLTDCVREANESCSGQTDMLGSLANLTSLDSFCKPALVCQLKATTCRALVLAVLPTGPPSGSESESTRGADLMQQLCPAYEQAAECLQALTATDQCREVEVVTNMTSSIAMAASGCAGVPSGQTQCGQKITECKTLLLNVSTELLPHLTPPYNNVTALETACSSQKQLTDCVREANESCSGQTDMLGSLANLTSLDSFCKPALICLLKATTCQAPVLAVLPTGPPSGSESESTRGADLMQQLCPAYEQAVPCLQALTATDQCREVEVVKISISSYAMAASRCATGGGERSSGHAMHWVLTTMTSLTAALLFGL